MAHVGKMPALERLRLSYTDITDNGMKHLAGLTKLQVLDLSGTDIGDAGLAQIAAFTNLRELYLNHARFTDKGLPSLKPLQNLERIEMFRTRTSNAGVEALAALEESRGGQAGLHRRWTTRVSKPCETLPQMRELSMDSTGVTDNGAQALKSMAGLKSLNLYHTLVTEKGHAGAEEPRCPPARSFSTAIRRCRIEGASEMRQLLSSSCALLARLPAHRRRKSSPAGDAQWIEDAGGTVIRDAAGRITGVDLRASWVTDTDLRKLLQLPNLTLPGSLLTRITDQGMQELKNLPGIVDLNLYFAEYVTDEGLAAIKDWKKLKRLNVHGTKISDTTLEHISGITTLESRECRVRQWSPTSASNG